MSGRTRYIWSDRAGQLLPEADWLIEEAMHRNKVGLQVVSDISEPVVSPVDGSVLSSRADVRGAQHPQRRRGRGERSGLSSSDTAED